MRGRGDELDRGRGDEGAWEMRGPGKRAGPGRGDEAAGLGGRTGLGVSRCRVVELEQHCRGLSVVTWPAMCKRRQSESVQCGNVRDVVGRLSCLVLSSRSAIMSYAIQLCKIITNTVLALCVLEKNHVIFSSDNAIN